MINWNCKLPKKIQIQIESELSAKNFAQTILISSFDSEFGMQLAKDLGMLFGCEQECICSKCRFCSLMLMGNNPDCFVFENFDENKFGIDEVRNLKKNLQLSTTAKARIVIIQNIERLSIPCLNALLKVLEEPPNKVFFILTTQDYREVLPTVISRSRIYILNKNINLETSKKWQASLKNLNSRADGLILAEELSKLGKSELKEFFLEFVQFLREKGEYSVLETTQQTYNLISQNVNTRIALEVLFLRYTGKCSIV